MRDPERGECISMEKNYREHELVERYVYDVTRRINEKQRKDIGEELRSLIEDMILEKLADAEENIEVAGKPDDEIVREVLTQMGDPAKLARKYRGEEEHLIGGEYFNMYWLVLKIVLICTTVGYVISGIVAAFVGAVETDGTTRIILDEIAHYMDLPGVLISAFGSVTLIFALMERAKVKLGDTIKWNIEKLPLVPGRKNEIKRSDCIVDIVFDVLFISVFAFAPTVLGLWIVENEQTICIPIFNIEIWSTLLPIFIISFLAGIVKEVVKLLEGCYNRIVLITSLATSAVSAVCTILLFKGFALWNPNFVIQLKEVYDVKAFSTGDIVIYFGDARMNTIFMTVVLLGIGIDVIVTVCKTIRADKS